MVAAAVVLSTVLVGLLWTFQRALIYLPGDGRVGAANMQVPGAREAALLTTTDGLDLGAWYVPATDGVVDGVGVLLANGNAGNRWARADLAQALADAGFATLLFDYRGYGGNPGSPSEASLALDVRAAQRFLVDVRGVPPSKLLYVGESLGAAVVTELATEHPPAGLLLRSPFVDLASVGKVHYPFLPVGLLLRDRFPVVQQVKDIRIPTTVVYGTADSVVPQEQSERVAAAAAGPVERVVLPGVDHNDPVLLDGAAVVSAVVELARAAG